MAPALENEISQFRELARHFFSRFFDNDLVAINADDADMRATVVNILAMLAAPGMLLPFLFLSKYVKLQDAPMYVRDLASLGEKEFFICFSMTVMGLVTVIEKQMKNSFSPREARSHTYIGASCSLTYFDRNRNGNSMPGAASMARMLTTVARMSASSALIATRSLSKKRLKKCRASSRN